MQRDKMLAVFDGATILHLPLARNGNNYGRVVLYREFEINLDPERARTDYPRFYVLETRGDCVAAVDQASRTVATVNEQCTVGLLCVLGDEELPAAEIVSIQRDLIGLLPARPEHVLAFGVQHPAFMRMMYKICLPEPLERRKPEEHDEYDEHRMRTGRKFTVDNDVFLSVQLSGDGRLLMNVLPGWLGVGMGSLRWYIGLKA